MLTSKRLTGGVAALPGQWCDFQKGLCWEAVHGRGRHGEARGVTSCLFVAQLHLSDPQSSHLWQRDNGSHCASFGGGCGQSATGLA
jgi:hypothetical protein